MSNIYDQRESIKRIIKILLQEHLDYVDHSIASKLNGISGENKIRTTNALLELAEKLTDYPEEKERALKLAFKTLPKDWSQTPNKLVSIATLSEKDDFTDEVISYIISYYEEYMNMKERTPAQNNNHIIQLQRLITNI